jgi:hypothetical protein
MVLQLERAKLEITPFKEFNCAKCMLSLLRFCPTQNAHARNATNVAMEKS